MNFDGPTSDGLLCWCRPGFEPELAAELGERAAQIGQAGYARAERNTGHVQYLGVDGVTLSAALPWNGLIFARQKLVRIAELRGVDKTDRISPIITALQGAGRFGDLLVEYPDSDTGKQLAALARAFGNALRPVLRKRGFLTESDDPRRARLHVCLLDGDHIVLAASDPGDSSPLPMGIPRLRAHADAPSRSALKLDEALLVLLTDAEREKLLQPGLTAADLGAAPGGWSWLLAQHHIRVFAVDNGPLAEVAHATGVIEHIRADGFRWQPPKMVDWLVCDMVEQPRRVAARMAEWFANRWCRQAIFNLKLPMKKRWDETRDCLLLFEEQAGKHLTIRARQLYHDREEITVFATLAK